jgi:hypothetical protein
MPAPDHEPTAVESESFGVPAHAVWAFRLDFANLPDYNPDVTGVERVHDGEGVGGASGSGARYHFELADARRPGRTHPVELWTIAVEESVSVVAGMKGGNEAYEEFVVEPLSDRECRATLSLWVTLPEGISPEMASLAATGSRQQIRKELDLMKVVLEGRAGGTSVH